MLQHSLTTRVLIAIVLVPVLWMVAGLIKQHSATWLPVRKVMVEGEFGQISRMAIKQRLLPLVSSGFFMVDLQHIQTTVVAMPWVKKAMVQRVWPDALKIRLHEQKAVARWSTDALLNAQGELFRPENAAQFTELALISGAKGQEKQLLGTMQALNAELMKHNLNLQQFRVNDGRSWRIVLREGAEINLGKSQPQRHFQRLLSVLPVLGAEKIAAMTTVDMRYPNGFAVAWKPGTQLDWKNEIKQQQSKRKS